MRLFLLQKHHCQIDFHDQMVAQTICEAATVPQTQPEDMPDENVDAQGKSSGEHKPSSIQALIILSEQE